MGNKRRKGESRSATREQKTEDNDNQRQISKSNDTINVKKPMMLASVVR